MGIHHGTLYGGRVENLSQLAQLLYSCTVSPQDLDMHDPPPIPMEVEPPEIGGDAALSVPATDTPTDQQHVPT